MAILPPSASERVALEKSKEPIQRYYRWVSRFYSLNEGWFEKALRHKAVELLAPQEGERILEIGCGCGFALRDVAPVVGRSGFLHGLDISPEMVQKARSNTRGSHGGQISLSMASAFALPFADETFDGIYMSGVLELYDGASRTEILREAGRVLKSRTGRCALAVMSDDGRASWLLRLYEGARGALPGVIPSRSVDGEQQAAQAGLRVQADSRVRLKGLVPIHILLLKY